MADEKNLARAKETFETLCRTFDRNEWHYVRDDSKLTIDCGARGEDLPMDITIVVDAEKTVILLMSHLPFEIQEDKRLDVAVAVSVVNNLLVDGCFDYSIASGDIFFRMTNSFLESQISEEVFAYMLMCSIQTIDKYNDQFLMISKGILSMEQFLSKMAE